MQSKVSSADKRKIDAHLDAVREIESRLQNSSIACEGPVLGDEVRLEQGQQHAGGDGRHDLADGGVALMRADAVCQHAVPGR